MRGVMTALKPRTHARHLAGTWHVRSKYDATTITEQVNGWNVLEGKNNNKNNGKSKNDGIAP